jgi:hypothetical protein
MPVAEPHQTSRRDLLAAAIYAVPIVGLMGQGLLYVTTTRFMPYHGEALATSWEMLPAHHQGFVLGVIKGMGAGSVAVTLALAILLLVPFRRGEAWARWAIPVVGAVFTGLTAYAAYTIDVRTPASTPWRQTLVLVGLFGVGAAVSCWPRRRPDDHG